MNEFEKLGLSHELLKVIEHARFTQPSEIQEKTIPLALAGKDIIGGSATGSGKTLAFGASIIDNAKRGEGIQALILTPTRELAEQIGQVLIKFSSFKKVNIAVVYGGVGIGPQINDLEEADIVVGTPGRILDHIERRTIDLRKVRTLVLDEADRMLDMGFIDDVDKIISFCPKQRQTMLFSATISQDIDHLAKKYTHQAVHVEVESYVDPSLLTQIYYDVPQDMKFSLLIHLLKKEHSGLVMVFCNTQRNTDFVANNLSRYDIDAIAIHGGLSQAKRNKVMDSFHSNRVKVLVCTDVASRGLDIKNVSHVYNYDAPNSDKEYIHRIGRTARAGKDGIAISIVSVRDYANFRNIVSNPDLKIKQEKLPEFEKVHINFGGGFHGERREGRFRTNRSFGRGDNRGGRRFDGRNSRSRDSGRFSRGRSSFSGRSSFRRR